MPAIGRMDQAVSTRLKDYRKRTSDCVLRRPDRLCYRPADASQIYVLLVRSQISFTSVAQLGFMKKAE